ncbi:hypothetical protein JAAARDRAFT_415440 [Jaapia argillacea MUCL 33604]|uniref:Uncharacterized protein n=1 Tax=Jaapia argillacea MUCL 33604 TaxID=933084 RepID=A0A067PGF6_9AGAM|nr:hypothetical protein JAAARDRAFT_415440 [Jaapia argillacea MUCL 33604]
MVMIIPSYTLSLTHTQALITRSSIPIDTSSLQGNINTEANIASKPPYILGSTFGFAKQASGSLLWFSSSPSWNFVYSSGPFIHLLPLLFEDKGNNNPANNVKITRFLSSDDGGRLLFRLAAVNEAHGKKFRPRCSGDTCCKIGDILVSPSRSRWLTTYRGQNLDNKRANAKDTTMLVLGLPLQQGDGHRRHFLASKVSAL